MKNKFTDLKFLSNIYLKLKEKKLHSTNLKVQKLQKLIDIEKKFLEEDMKHLDDIVKENASIIKNFDKILMSFEKANKTITIKNNNYHVNIWDNVYLKKKFSYYAIVTKKDEEIYIFDDNIKDFADYFLSLNHSIIVLSVDKKRITLQFRLKELQSF